MPTKMNMPSSELALNRLLEAFEQDLLDASDEEIIQAAQDLGMNPQLKGSAAFAGLKYPARPQLSDFFDLERNIESPKSRQPTMRRQRLDADEK